MVWISTVIGTNLIAACIGLGLCVWGISSHHLSFLFGMVAIGAVSYFVGIFLAMVATCVVLLGDLCILGLHGFSVSVELVKLAGYICISWLQKVTSELSRLESIFTQLERDKRNWRP